jgi:hypothetical protein
MSKILNYTKKNPDVRAISKRPLRLMLWAGDGEHDGVSDVARLQGYDVFLCLGFTHIDKNVSDLSDSQVIVVINVNDRDQMTRFCEDFREAFSHIDSDYYGNTPTLPIGYYNKLLAPGGTARNIVGLNGLIMVDEDMLNTIELFAPVLDYETRNKRMWSNIVLSLARDNGLSPGETWSSPDLKNPLYNFVRENQDRFIHWQRVRNSTWPALKGTLQEQWESLGVNVITSRLVLPIEQVHLEEFNRFLTRKIESILKMKQNFTLVQSAMDEKCYGKDLLATIRIQQQVILDLTEEIPSSITGIIGRYIDERHASRPTEFGLSLFKKSHL